LIGAFGFFLEQLEALDSCLSRYANDCDLERKPNFIRDRKQTKIYKTRGLVGGYENSLKECVCKPTRKV
jgi:hypothetical protein